MRRFDHEGLHLSPIVLVYYTYVQQQLKFAHAYCTHMQHVHVYVYIMHTCAIHDVSEAIYIYNYIYIYKL